jgi:hypothetical protein
MRKHRYETYTSAFDMTNRKTISSSANSKHWITQFLTRRTPSSLSFAEPKFSKYSWNNLWASLAPTHTLKSSSRTRQCAKLCVTHTKMPILIRPINCVFISTDSLLIPTESRQQFAFNKAGQTQMRSPIVSAGSQRACQLISANAIQESVTCYKKHFLEPIVLHKKLTCFHHLFFLLALDRNHQPVLHLDQQFRSCHLL